MGEPPHLTWEPHSRQVRCNRAGLDALITRTRPDQPATPPPPPDTALTLLNNPETGDAIRALLRPVHASTSQVNCVIATPEHIHRHRAWVTTATTTVLTPADDTHAQLTLIPTGFLPITLATWVHLGPPHSRPHDHPVPPGDHALASAITSGLLHQDAARRTHAFTLTGADLAWDLELVTGATTLAMTIHTSAGHHHDLITTAGRTVLRPVTATTLFHRFTDLLTALPPPPIAHRTEPHP